MKRSLISVALVIAACGGSGARGVSWEDTTPLSGAVEPGAAPDGAAALRLTGPGTHPLIVLDDPGVDGEYVITGMVSYEGVTAGYLEMWSVFGESRYFTRTLAESGELGVLRGDSEWRPFALPFFAAPGMAPTSLEINLVLDGPGTVWIGPLGVAGATTAGGGSVKWGLVGAIAGTTVGMLGAFIGSLAARGRGRRFSLGSLVVVAAGGLVLAVWGLVVIGFGAGWEAGYPPLLIGVVLLGLPILLFANVRRRYAEAELRRITAADAH
ncbi:MAG: hypothetical protein A2135_02730 [Actinobacteria bacterium RBG_16_67_15]|nr:MAG: hypothetical protein A2135_02730 [Actinobacteria bacterium RBG_16_67_15]